MDDSTVLVHDRDGNEWNVEPDPTTDLGTFAKGLLAEGASATAKLADGHFVVIPARSIARVEVMTAEAMAARFDSRSEPRSA